MIRVAKGDALTMRSEDWFKEYMDKDGNIMLNEPNLKFDNFERFKSLMGKRISKSFNFHSCGFYIIIKSSDGRDFDFPYWCFEEFNPMIYDRNEILDVAKHLGGKDAVHRAYEMIFDINTNF